MCLEFCGTSSVGICRTSRDRVRKEQSQLSSASRATMQVLVDCQCPLSPGAMAALLSARTGKEVNYREVPPPPVPDMEQLWGFLRGGGFDISTGNVKAVTGEEPICFSDFLAGLDFQ